MKDNTKYLENLHNLYSDSDLPFLPEIMKIENVKKLVANLHGKEQNVIHIRTLKRALSYHRLVLKKVNRVIKFNKKTWLKSFNDINNELRKKAKNNFKNE